MADQSSREIERDLERKRAELSDTIDEALNRMTLEGAWTYAGRYLRDNRGTYGQTVGSVIKEKPLAVGLVAIGMAWIMFGPSNVARQAAREGRDDRRDDAETRRRLETGEFDDTTARGPTGRKARPDPWAAPSRTPSPTPSSTGTATTGTRTGAAGGTSSPTTSTSTTPGGTSSNSTQTSSGAHSTRGTGDRPVTAPAVAPASTPTSTTGSTSSGSTGSGTSAGAASDTSSGTTTDSKSPKV